MSKDSDNIEVAKAVVAELQKGRNIAEEKHKADHAFIDSLIKKQNQRADTWQAVKVHVLKYGALSLLSFLGVLTWHFMKEHIK